LADFVMVLAEKARKKIIDLHIASKKACFM